MSHEDFRPMSDAEFRERFPPVQKSVEPKLDTPKRSAQQEANELARRAASLCWRIRNTFKPEEWAGQIASAPEELRVCLREYLVQAWRAMQHEKKGKKSQQGDAELAKMSDLVRRL